MSKELLKALNSNRNTLIATLKIFRNSATNRKYMKPSHFSITINSIKKEIKVVDDLISGYKNAKSKTKESGILHIYNEKTKEIHPVNMTMYAVFDRTKSKDESLKYDLSNLVSIFPDYGSAYDEKRVAQEWEFCKVEVSVKILKD